MKTKGSKESPVQTIPWIKGRGMNIIQETPTGSKRSNEAPGNRQACKKATKPGALRQLYR
jgi:hypothetical protein